MAYQNKLHGATFDQTNFATRTVAFLQVDMGTDVETNYNHVGSLYQKAVQGLQQIGELYGLGQPNGNWFTAIVSADTFPLDGQLPQSGNDLASAKAAVDSATGGSCTVWNARVNGSNIENNC